MKKNKKLKKAKPNFWKKVLILVFSIAYCLAAGGIGSYFTMSQIPTWYAQLAKPVFNPPNWVFGPVWTLLYILMGISLFLLLDRDFRKDKKAWSAGVLFDIQLILNIMWSVIFFTWHNLLLAYVEILFLLVAIIFTARKAYLVNKIAGLLFIPYILWVAFASFLNLAIYLLNR